MVFTTPAAARSLYVHVPYCHTICGYCDFYSEILDDRQVGPLVDVLLAELEQYTREACFKWETIFVGGGTPTTLPPELLKRLLSGLCNGTQVVETKEFTVEANPATVSQEVADTLVACGVNRISIGAQSFDPGELRVLDRIHRVDDVERTVLNARRAGIHSLNLDLIFAVPGQTLDAWLANLDAALELLPDHLSCYGLTYERGTPLYERLAAGGVRRADAELEADMYEATIEKLSAAGFEHYEISNFARPAARCAHNLVYWKNLPALGIGPSAAGLIDDVRYKNVPDTAEYMRAMSAGRSPVIERERLDRNRRARETMMLGLRLIDGIDRTEFAARFGGDPVEMFSEAVARHAGDGLLEVTEQRLRLSRRGLLLADSIMADFL